ncbi:YcnI family copper-binding membrane protein [Paractinoplanes lichenicola]|uniref:YcnI family protein n=1 Tax=Paractinoplanes lichenicola TaxID=2802976 RepID=A0ABS1VVG3_9ACTN|nr:YcnI family protein [Actinoplanes lichenicola]MBL7258469.1 YcnI family protein [Actinoplanes lichenicola]
MSLFKRSALVGATVIGFTLALAAPASAHVSVNPGTAEGGGYSKVTFRVPNESDKESTTKVEINLPADKPVASVSVKPLTGWDVATTVGKLDKPLEAHGAQITEAVSKITWTAKAGSEIKPGQFQEFDVSMGPLPESGDMIFKALQTYSDNTIVRWIDEPNADGTEPESPAPVLKLTAAGAEGADTNAAAPTAAAAVETTEAQDSDDPDVFGIAGLVAGVLALIVAMLAYARSARRPSEAVGASSSSASSPSAPSSDK